MRFLTAPASMALTVSAPAQAAFPEKDVTIVIPYGPGGGLKHVDSEVIALHRRIFRAETVAKTSIRLKSPKICPARKGCGLYLEAEARLTYCSDFQHSRPWPPYIKGENPGYDIEAYSWLNRCRW